MSFGVGLSAVALFAATSARGEDGVKDPLLAALVAELERSKEGLSSAVGDERMYYLAYRCTDANSIDCSASYGALDDAGHEDENAGRRRTFDITLRVGSPKLDNTHRMRGEWSAYSGPPRIGRIRARRHEPRLEAWRQRVVGLREESHLNPRRISAG